VLELLEVTRRFGARVAVDALSASLLPGTVTGFLGPNGAGKTTTIKMIAGLLVPTSGTVRVFGHDVVKAPDEAKRRLAYIPDRPYVPERLSARELLRYVAGLYGAASTLADTEGIDALARFGLAGREDDLLGTFSHGMRQRVLLASAFMRRPNVLLVDEPMVGLDPQGARLVKRVLREAADDGAVVLMSTHTLPVVEELCDRVIVVGKGVKVADGTVAELKARVPPNADGTPPTLEDLFVALTGASDEVSESSSSDPVS